MKTEVKKVFPFVLIAAIVLGYLIWKHHLPWYELISDGFLLLFGGLAAISDLKTQQVPNRIVLLLLASWVLELFLRLLFVQEGISLFLLQSGSGCLIAGVVFLTVYILSKKGLGGGDVKFMAAAGLLLGGRAVLPVILIGSVLSSVICLVLILLKKKKKTDTMPLIPFLYLGILLLLAAK